MDVTTILGLAVGVGFILAGQALEGGHLGSIVQLTAALIVVGGTAGAVVTQFPLADLRRGLAEARFALWSKPAQMQPIARQFAELARLARREGLLALEGAASRQRDPFLKVALLQLVDGTDAAALRGMLDGLAEQEEQLREAGPRIFEAAGGYAPTIGILGAVLGLIHVMENLSDPAKLGAGIAVAFVATVYGVGSANLIFLPIAQKLRSKLRDDARRKQLIIEGICAIQEGMNPNVVEKRLRTLAEAAA
jgi:chemotaxis protein MotA